MNSWYLILDAKLPQDVCDDLINLYKSNESQKAKIGNKSVTRDKQYRETNVVGLPYGSNEHKAISELINPYVYMANRESFGFALNNVSEFPTCRIQQRTLLQRTYGLCMNGIASQRKLSVTVQLSEPKDYEGGEFLFSKDIGTPDQNIMKEQGRIVIFSSFVYHEVKPVTSGKRYSLVGWYEGNHWT